MSEHILTDKMATDKMVAGATKLANVVSKTLGADGKIVFAEHPAAKIPLGTKDGATVAAWIEYPDKFENMGANLIKFAANKTAMDAGDGTTTSTILSEALIRTGIEKVNQGFNSRKISRGMEKARDIVIEQLKKSAKNIKTKDALLKKVALVSSNNDDELANLITDVVKKIGKDAIINVEKNLGTKTTMEYVDGMVVNSTYSHPVFINNTNNECVLENVAIILCDYEISKITEIGHIFQAIGLNQGENKPTGIQRNPGKPSSYRKVDSFLFIAKEVQGEALSSLAKSKSEHNAPVAIAKAPGGDDFAELMRDIAIVTGGKLIAENEGFSMEQMNPHTDVGWAKKIILGPNTLTIVEGESDPKKFSDRIMRLGGLETSATNPRDKAMYRQRAARMTGSVARLFVGGPNDSEIKRRADSADDTTRAVRSALEEGITAGGGVSFLRAISALDNAIETDREVKEGISLIKDALLVPIRTILANSGHTPDEISKIIFTLQGSKNVNNGYNTLTGKIEDLLKNGIIDPVKVLRCAIENATTVSVQFLSTGAALYFLPDEIQRR